MNKETLLEKWKIFNKNDLIYVGFRTVKLDAKLSDPQLIPLGVNENALFVYITGDPGSKAVKRHILSSHNLYYRELKELFNVDFIHFVDHHSYLQFLSVKEDLNE